MSTLLRALMNTQNRDNIRRAIERSNALDVSKDPSILTDESKFLQEQWARGRLGGLIDWDYEWHHSLKKWVKPLEWRRFTNAKLLQTR